MGWILGFGIPIVYLTATLYVTRACYRSMHKRDKLDRWDDWELTLTFMGIFWPVLAPIYFPWVTFKKHKDDANFFQWFFKKNLPESYAAKDLRLAQEAYEKRKRIHELEKQCGLKPTEDRVYDHRFEESWY